MDSRIKKNILIFVLSILIIFGLTGFLMFRNWSLERSVLEERKEVHSMELKLASYDKLKEEHTKIVGEEGTKLANRFTYTDRAVDFIAAIEEAAKEAGVDLTIDIYKEPVSNKDKEKNKGKEAAEKEEELNFQLTAKGDFNQFLVFLVKLENLERYSRIRRVEISKEMEKTKVLDEDGDETVEDKEVLVGEVIIKAY